MLPPSLLSPQHALLLVLPGPESTDVPSLPTPGLERPSKPHPAGPCWRVDMPADSAKASACGSGASGRTSATLMDITRTSDYLRINHAERAAPVFA